MSSTTSPPILLSFFFLLLCTGRGRPPWNLGLDWAPTRPLPIRYHQSRRPLIPFLVFLPPRHWHWLCPLRVDFLRHVLIDYYSTSTRQEKRRRKGINTIETLVSRRKRSIFHTSAKLASQASGDCRVSQLILNPVPHLVNVNLFLSRPTTPRTPYTSCCPQLQCTGTCIHTESILSQLTQTQSRSCAHFSTLPPLLSPPSRCAKYELFIESPRPLHYLLRYRSFLEPQLVMIWYLLFPLRGYVFNHYTLHHNNAQAI